MNKMSIYHTKILFKLKHHISWSILDLGKLIKNGKDKTLKRCKFILIQ